MQLAYGKDVWMPGYDMKLIEEMKKKEKERVKNSSYGKINYSQGAMPEHKTKPVTNVPKAPGSNAPMKQYAKHPNC
jgi:hypothetical protein